MYICIDKCSLLSIIKTALAPPSSRWSCTPLRQIDERLLLQPQMGSRVQLTLPDYLQVKFDWCVLLWQLVNAESQLCEDLANDGTNGGSRRPEWGGGNVYRQTNKQHVRKQHVSDSQNCFMNCFTLLFSDISSIAWLYLFNLVNCHSVETPSVGQVIFFFFCIHATTAVLVCLS